MTLSVDAFDEPRLSRAARAAPGTARTPSPPARCRLSSWSGPRRWSPGSRCPGRRRRRASIAVVVPAEADPPTRRQPSTGSPCSLVKDGQGELFWSDPSRRRRRPTTLVRRCRRGSDRSRGPARRPHGHRAGARRRAGRPRHARRRSVPRRDVTAPHGGLLGRRSCPCSGCAAGRPVGARGGLVGARPALRPPGERAARLFVAPWALMAALVVVSRCSPPLSPGLTTRPQVPLPSAVPTPDRAWLAGAVWGTPGLPVPWSDVPGPPGAPPGAPRSGRTDARPSCHGETVAAKSRGGG